MYEWAESIPQCAHCDPVLFAEPCLLLFWPQSVHRVAMAAFCRTFTVKRVDEVVRHPHLVEQDQITQVSKKVSDIPEENFTINIELF